MLWQKFDKCGLYYFADKSDKECSSYIGIIAVKPKPEHKILEYNTNEKKFNTGLIYIFQRLI